MKKRWGITARKRIEAINYLISSLGLFFCAGVVFADSVSGGGLSSVASNAISNLDTIARLITAGSYLAGFAFGVAAVVKFKAHKDNPTQVMISQPIVLLFVAAALIFIPSVFKTTGGTLFGSGVSAAGTSGVASF